MITEIANVIDKTVSRYEQTGLDIYTALSLTESWIQNAGKQYFRYWKTQGTEL